MTTTHRGPVDGPAAAQAAGRRTAVVVGGGLAGTTAALALADAGLRVTLTEARPRLGGLAFSFQRGELTVDNGQHVFLRCCTAYQWFLDRIAARDLVTLQDRLDVPVLRRGHRPDSDGSAGPRCRYRCTWRPAWPRYPHLSSARARLGRPRRPRAARPGPGRPGAGRYRLRKLARRARPVRPAPSRRCGTWSASPRSTRPSGHVLARARRHGLQDRAAVRRRRRRHRLGQRPARRPARRPGPYRAGRRRRTDAAAHPRPPRIEAAAGGGWQVEVETGPGRGEQLDRRHRGAGGSAARDARPAARRRAGGAGNPVADRHRADPQCPCDLRQAGARPSRSSRRSAALSSGSSTAPGVPA